MREERMTIQLAASFRRMAFGSLLGVGLLLGLAHCSGGTGTSSTGSGSASGCSTICACVRSNGGSASTCMSECTAIAARTSNPQSDCESTLAGYGYPQCDSACSSFGKSAASGGTSIATVGDFCEKCSTCVSEPGFSEGFCTPFKKSGGFDIAACNANGKRSELAKPSLSKSELDALSCDGFDDAE